MIRQSIVWRSFLLQRFSLQPLSKQKLRHSNGAFHPKLHWFALFFQRYSRVPQACSFQLSPQSWYHTMHFSAQSGASGAGVWPGSAAEHTG